MESVWPIPAQPFLALLVKSATMELVWLSQLAQPFLALRDIFAPATELVNSSTLAPPFLALLEDSVIPESVSRSLLA